MFSFRWTKLLNSYQRRLLRIEVLFQVLGSQDAGDSVGGDLDFGGPENGVQNELAEVVVAPAFVVVAACEAEAAATIGPLEGPCHVLDFAVSNGGAHRGIALVRTVGAIHCGRRGHR